MDSELSSPGPRTFQGIMRTPCDINTFEDSQCYIVGSRLGVVLPEALRLVTRQSTEHLFLDDTRREVHEEVHPGTVRRNTDRPV